MKRTRLYILCTLIIVSGCLVIVTSLGLRQDKKDEALVQYAIEENTLQNHVTRYEGTYTAKNLLGTPVTFTAIVYAPNSSIPDDYWGSVEERLAEQIKKMAKNRNVDLEANFQENIMIRQILE